jgi:hypothetical protein
MFRLNVTGCFISKSVSAADSYLSEGKIVQDELTANKGKFLKFRIGTRTQQFDSRRTKFKTIISIMKKKAFKCTFYCIRNGNVCDLVHSHDYDDFVERNDCDTKLKTFAEYVQAGWCH